MHLQFTQFRAKAASATAPGFYSDVLVIEKGPAKGHFAVKEGPNVVNYDPANPAHAKLQRYQIVIGDATLDDVVRCGTEAEFAKCKLDHGSTVRDIVGNYAAFRRDGDQVRADLTLDSRFDGYNHAVALVDKMSKNIGNSIDFVPYYEIQGETALARCVKLNSVDIVDAPAATNSLFEQNQPTNPQRMALTAEEIRELRSMFQEEISTANTALETKFNSRFEEMKTKMAEGDDDDEEKAKKKKEDDEKDKGDKMSALVNTAALSAVQKLFPKATLESLTSLATQVQEKSKDEYAEKAALALSAGISPRDITRFMAAKHPALYNAKFGNLVASATL